MLMICAVACIACSKDCPAVLELGTEFLEVPAEGGTYTLDIRSNTLWEKIKKICIQAGVSSIDAVLEVAKSSALQSVTQFLLP